MKLTANQMSLPQTELPTHVCLKYRASKIPKEAVPIQAVNMKAPCNLYKILEAASKLLISAKALGSDVASRPIS